MSVWTHQSEMRWGWLRIGLLAAVLLLLLLGGGGALWAQDGDTGEAGGEGGAAATDDGRIGRADVAEIEAERQAQRLEAEAGQQDTLLAERFAVLPGTQKLAHYFGFLGLVAMLGWGVAGGLALGWALRLRRHDATVAAVGAVVVFLVVLTLIETGMGLLATLGLLLGGGIGHKFLPRPQVGAATVAVAVVALALSSLNFDYVSEIEPDYSQQIAEEIRSQQEARQALIREQRGTLAGQVQFAEDTMRERLDLAGVEDEEEQAKLLADAEPAWKKFVTQEQRTREANTSRGLEETEELAQDAEAAAAATRKMLPDKLQEARKLDGYNWLLARWIFWLALAVFVLDYLLRFNETFAKLVPLPIAGRWLDVMRAKQGHLIRLGEGASEQFLPWALKRAVHKGETFIDFGDEDPWPERLHRVESGWLRLWSVPKLTIGPREEDLDSEFVFESLWFGRGFAVVSAQQREAVLRELLAFLELRHHTKASVGRSVWLAWPSSEPMPVDVLERLRVLCPATNFRLIMPSSAAGKVWPEDDLEAVTLGEAARPGRYTPLSVVFAGPVMSVLAMVGMAVAYPFVRWIGPWAGRQLDRWTFALRTWIRSLETYEPLPPALASVPAALSRRVRATPEAPEAQPVKAPRRGGAKSRGRDPRAKSQAAGSDRAPSTAAPVEPAGPVGDVGASALAALAGGEPEPEPRPESKPQRDPSESKSAQPSGEAKKTVKKVVRKKVVKRSDGSTEAGGRSNGGSERGDAGQTDKPASSSGQTNSGSGGKKVVRKVVRKTTKKPDGSKGGGG